MFRLSFLLIVLSFNSWQIARAQIECAKSDISISSSKKSACLIQCEVYYQKNPQARPPSTARTCESVAETLQAHIGPLTPIIGFDPLLNKNNQQLLESCGQGAWDGVLTFPEQVRAYAKLVDDFGSFIHQAIRKKAEWVTKCDADIACKREIARIMPAYRARKPEARACVFQDKNNPACADPYLVPNSAVDAGIQGMDIMSLADIAAQNRSSLQKTCEVFLIDIDRKIRDEQMAAGEDTDWGDQQLQQRYDRIAAQDPDCPAALKLDKPQKLSQASPVGTKKPTWLESLGIKWDCYPPEKVDQLVCMEIAKQVVDPLNLLAGSGALAAKTLKLAGLGAESAVRTVARQSLQSAGEDLVPAVVRPQLDSMTTGSVAAHTPPTLETALPRYSKPKKLKSEAQPEFYPWDLPEEPVSPALTELLKYQQAGPRKVVPTHEHVVTIKDGKAYVTIGLLEKENDKEFMRLLNRAVKDGDVAEIDAGTVVGGKVLNLLTRVKDIVPKGKSVLIKGSLDLESIEANLKQQLQWTRDGGIKSGPFTVGNDSSLKRRGLFWTDKDQADFQQALQTMHIEETCLKLRGTKSLKDCGTLHFQFDSQHPDAITWTN